MQANTYEADSLWKLEECHVFYCHECHGITVRQLRSLYLSQKPEHTHLAPSHLLSSHCNGNQNSNLKSNSGINSNKVSTDAQNVSSVLYVSSLTHENHTDNAITPQLHQNKNSPPYNYLYSARRIQNSNITNLPKTNQTDYKWGKNHINNERQGTESHTPRFMRQTVSSRMKIKSKYSTRNSSMWRPRNTNVDSDKNFFNMASITNPASISEFITSTPNFRNSAGTKKPELQRTVQNELFQRSSVMPHFMSPTASSLLMKKTSQKTFRSN